MFGVRDGFWLVRILAPVEVWDLPGNLCEEFGQVVLVSERWKAHPILALSGNHGQFRLPPILYFQPFIRLVFLFTSPCLREAIPLMRKIRYPKYFLVVGNVADQLRAQ